MAAYISVPRDLSKVKSKIFFNLTKRQLICFSIAASDLSDQLLKDILDMESSQIVTMHICSLDQNKAVRAGYDMDIIPSDLAAGGKEGLQPIEKTVIDRCVHQIYQSYFNDPRPENMPVLEDLYDELMKQDEKEEQTAAYSVEIWKRFRKNPPNLIWRAAHAAPMHLKQAERPSHIDKQGNSE
jgi:hypothetical protein